jgi:hypothetical protein
VRSRINLFLCKLDPAEMYDIDQGKIEVFQNSKLLHYRMETDNGSNGERGDF